MKVVGISDYAVSRDPDEVVVTYALGSCVAVLAHDPVSRIGGLLHYMLPEDSADGTRAAANPAMFGSTGIPLLFEQMKKLGADQRRFVVRLAGGAQVLGDENIFNIGKKNQLLARKLLWKIGVLIHGEALGGTVARTVRLEVGTGKVWIREGATEGAMQPVAAQRRA